MIDVDSIQLSLHRSIFDSFMEIIASTHVLPTNVDSRHCSESNTSLQFVLDFMSQLILQDVYFLIIDESFV